MKLIRTALATMVMAAALPIAAHAQDRDKDRDSDRDRNNVNNTYQDRDRDGDRDRYRANNAAYQDGWNKGMSDGQRHKKSKVKYGRWKNQDREAFAAGYNRAYRQYYNNNNNNNRRDRDHGHDRN